MCTNYLVELEAIKRELLIHLSKVSRLIFFILITFTFQFDSVLYKKPTLDTDNFKNFRHAVSNLKFLSKVTEKAVASQIKLHIRQFDIDNRYQSAYKAHHSTKPLFSLSRMTFSLIWNWKIVQLVRSLTCQQRLTW